VWATYRAAGARFLVVSGIIESAELRAAYAGCLVGCDVQMVRLEAPPELVERRTRGTVRGPMWDLQAALKAHESLAHSEDFTVRNDRPLGEVAAEILVMAGWISGEDG
jgi:chloramphenicol 3-O-phosphotransferase